MNAHDPEVQKELFYLKSVEETQELLQTGKDGLTTTEATLRLDVHGPNALQEKPPVPGWKKFLMQFNDFLIWILIGAAVFSLIAAFIEYATQPEHPPDFWDAIIIGIILLINATLGYLQERQAEQAIDALKRMSAAKARVVRDGDIKEIFASEVAPGDIVVLETGDAVPADCRVVEANELKVEEASLTGESSAVKKLTSPIESECGLGDRVNLVFSSTIVTYGRGRAIAVATGMNTELGKIAKYISETEDEATPLAKKIDAFGKKLGNLILIVCAVTFGLYMFQGYNNFIVPGSSTWLEVILSSIMVAIALAVAAIPEGLPAIVTTSLALGVQRMAKKNAIVRKLPSVETLGCTTVICSDKTGTLTKNEMTIRLLYVNDDFLELSGNGYEPVGEFFTNDGSKVDATKHEELNLLAKAGVSCNNSTLRKDEGKWIITGDPTEAAFLTLGGKLGYTRSGLEQTGRRVSEVFFSSERKKMTTVDKNDEDGSLFVAMKGGLEPMLPNCTCIMINGKITPLNQGHVDKLLAAQDKMSSQALRVLAVGFKAWKKDEADFEPDTVEKDLVLIGLVGMLDPPRGEAKDAVAKCKIAGINTIMITGDHAATAKAIALELGILDANATGTHQIIQGMEIDKLSDQELLQCNVFARVAPEHKMRIVKVLQSSGHIVSMTGDGVNDAPALKKADAGVAMGITGTDVSKSAADIVLADDNFASIVAAVEEGRAIYDNMKRFINFLISCNLGEILVVFMAALLFLPVPLLAIHLLWVNLLTDGLPALAMGFETPDSDLMVREPKPPEEPIITPRNKLSYVGSGLFIAFSCVVTFWWGLGGLGDTTPIQVGAVNLQTNYFQILSEIQAGSGPNIDQLISAGYTFDELRSLLIGDSGLLLAYPRTLAFSSLVVSESMNALNCRSELISMFKKKLSDNYFLMGSLVLTMALNMVVIYVPAAAAAFKLTSITWVDWLFVAAIASPRIWSEEIIKTYWNETHVSGKIKERPRESKNILFDVMAIALPALAMVFFLIFGVFYPPPDHALEQVIVTIALIIAAVSYIVSHLAVVKAKSAKLAMIMANVALIVCLIIAVDIFTVYIAS